MFPFLTADAFIFAATGLDNPFIVPLSFALRQVRFADRETTTAKPAGPVSTSRARDQRASGDKGNGPVKERESWRRLAARALGKLDIEL